MLEMDKSTIDRNALSKLRVYVKPESYTIDKSFGSACHGSPPGFPSYLIQHVYTKYGNSPSKGATELIMGRVLMTADEDYRKREAKLMKLWNPLPYNHPRVRAWIVEKYRHLKHCYMHPSYVDKQGVMEIVTGPSIWSSQFRLKSFHDDPRFSDEWREKAKEEVNTYNLELYQKWAEVGKPEYHAAYVMVKQYYPEHVPDLELIESCPEVSEGDWWEVLDHKPSPEECPGTLRWGRSGRPHPSNGSTWCQMCGWRQEAAVK